MGTAYDPSEDEEVGPCNFFCLWTHLHGWRNFALTKNKGFWIVWIFMFLLLIILAGFSLRTSLWIYSMGITDTWTKYDYIWTGGDNNKNKEGDEKDDDNKDWTGFGPLEFPSMTICPEKLVIPNNETDICESLGISGIFGGFDNETTEVMTSFTDLGACCTIKVGETKKVKVGMANGVKVLIFPGLDNDGVYMAFHERREVPLMKITGKFVPKGKDGYLDIKPDRYRMIKDCFDEKDGANDKPKMKHNFGDGLTMSNCLYNNMMEKIIPMCECDNKDDQCNQTQWECASKILEDPYSYVHVDPVYCLETCNGTKYTPMMETKTLTKNPELCEKWLDAIDNVCKDNNNVITGYSQLCTAITSALGQCQNNNTQYPENSNGNVLGNFAKKELISMQIYFKNYWMETHFEYYVKDTAKFASDFVLTLVAFFGFSWMMIPELLYFLFCGKGGGCVCRPVLDSCME